ncbi:DMT family transporter [Helicobacter canadensis]|uniref:Guanidinium exporter n=1 Tax=Helicobacter canadensis MIT 98-5491 TaxID=537970 RepID=C5ZVB1_9HELI|nr:SMR family transporter [Helicobacter canadensis]EES88741.1 multidrug resistance protein, SMR family [Helicobacter canadensis MIT 98-5491]EFR48967.1 multidrug resistance protein, SMR family [Helicobacter canadensis MIT 98-5491]STP00006.1 SMR family multidrug efflux pump [Helicobacter canadensis]
MSWVFLILAGIAEIFGVICLKNFALKGKKIYLLGIILLFILSLSLLSLGLREIPMSIAYAIWTGIGTAGGVLVGIFLYNESKSFLKLFFVTCIVVCSVGLKAFS